MDGWIHRRSPNDPIGRITNRQCGKWNLLLPEPHQNLPDRLQLVELPEYKCDRFLNSPIGVLLDFVEPRFNIAHGHGQKELAPARLLLHGFDGTLAKNRKLHLAHRALHTKKKPIVRRGWIINPVLIDNNRANEAAELQQCVPVTPIAGQARGFDRKHSADAAFTNRGEQSLKCRTTDAAARSPEIIVNYLNVLPTQLAGTVRQAILSALAL